MAAKKKAAFEKKSEQVRFMVTPSVLEEINELAKRHGYEDNRSKYIELAARGLIQVDRSKAGLE